MFLAPQESCYLKITTTVTGELSRRFSISPGRVCPLSDALSWGQASSCDRWGARTQEDPWRPSPAAGFLRAVWGPMGRSGRGDSAGGPEPPANPRPRVPPAAGSAPQRLRLCAGGHCGAALTAPVQAPRCLLGASGPKAFHTAPTASARAQVLKQSWKGGEFSLRGECWGARGPRPGCVLGRPRALPRLHVGAPEGLVPSWVLGCPRALSLAPSCRAPRGLSVWWGKHFREMTPRLDEL